MIAAGIVEWAIGVPAEHQPLETVATPLTSARHGGLGAPGCEKSRHSGA